MKRPPFSAMGLSPRVRELPMFRDDLQRRQVVLALLSFSPPLTDLWNAEEMRPTDALLALAAGNRDAAPLPYFTGATEAWVCFAVWLYTNDERSPMFSAFVRWDPRRQQAAASLLAACAGDRGGQAVDAWLDSYCPPPLRLPPSDPEML